MLLTCILPVRSAAQLNDNMLEHADPGPDAPPGNVSLGELARYLREHKQAQAAAPVIDNDNFSHVMQEAEKQKSKGVFSYAIDSVKNMFQVSSEDVTCSLSFNANASSLLTDSYSPRKMPQAELAKLSGPARIDGSNLEVTVNNASGWTVRELTVGLTIVHPDIHSDGQSEDQIANAGMPNLLPATIETTEAATDTEKQPDTTVLLHLKGAGAPTATTVFRQALDAPLAPGEQWHWAIIDAEGVPPSSPPVLAQAAQTATQASSEIGGNPIPASITPSPAMDPQSVPVLPAPSKAAVSP